MRRISALLFLVGIPWALFAWVAVPMGTRAAFDLLRPDRFGRHHGTPIVAVFALVLSAQAVFGYVIWANWLSIATRRRLPSRRFWSLAALHHFAWVLVAGPWMPREIRLGPPLFWYSLPVFVCCVVAARRVGGGRISADSQGFGPDPLGSHPA